MRKIQLSSKLKDIRRSAPMIVFALVIGLIGTISLLLSHGSSPNISTETEDGTITCATKTSDTSASAGQAVRFDLCGSGFDNSGKIIPDSNYAVPTSNVIFMATTGSDSSTGSRTQPVKTLNRAIALVPAGGTIVVRGGTNASPAVYRDWYHTTNTNLNTEVEGASSKKFTLQAFPHEKAWFDGTDVKPASSWTSDGKGHYYIAWNTPSFCGTSSTDTASQYYSQPLTKETDGPCSHADMSRDPSNTLAKDPQMVFVDGTYEHEETSLAAVQSDSFYYDWTAKRIYIGINPAGHTVELAARPGTIQLLASGAKVLGLGFRRYATDEYDNFARGTIISAGASQVFENNVFTQMAGGGMGISSGNDNSVFNHNIYAFNGYDGMRGSAGDNFVFTNNLVNNNNTERFATDCDASCGNAGLKIAHAHAFTVKNNEFTNNIGQGFWCDVDCVGGTIVNNLAQNNTKAGIVFEISDQGIIASNLVIGSGDYGIRVASANTQIYNNTVINSASAGIWVYDDGRAANPGSVGPDTVNTSIVNNVISGAGIAIKAQGTAKAQTSPADSNFFTAFNHNSYYRTGGTSQNLFTWILPSGTTSYKSIASLKADYPTLLGSDTDDSSSVNDPFFVSLSKKNYHIRSGSSAYNSGAAIPTAIGTKVGTASNAANQSRGVLVWPNVQ